MINNVGEMKQIVITKSGDQNVLKNQETVDLMPAKGELKIRVKVTGINFADVYIVLKIRS